MVRNAASDIAVKGLIRELPTPCEPENWLGQQIVGQEDLIHKLMLALLADGHLLVEGAPGLAKTRAIKEMAGIEGSFHRIQFTPDLLPATSREPIF